MKPVILDEPSQSNHGTTAPSTGLTRPDSFSTITGRFVGQIRSVLGGNEVRALAVDKVGSPVLQVCLIVVCISMTIYATISYNRCS
jgi:hypothetical protein